MKRLRWAMRLVKNGAVRIKGETFRPEERHQKYDGRLDGLWLSFALYWTGDEWQRESVHLWGSAEMKNAPTHVEYLAACRVNPCLVDGRFPWDLWRRAAR